MLLIQKAIRRCSQDNKRCFAYAIPSIRPFRSTQSSSEQSTIPRKRAFTFDLRAPALAPSILCRSGSRAWSRYPAAIPESGPDLWILCSSHSHLFLMSPGRSRDECGTIDGSGLRPTLSWSPLRRERRAGLPPFDFT
jgi:hypothetical protein